MPNRTVAVLGAGYVGLALAEACRAAGDAAWAVRRSAGDGWLRGDVATGRVDGLPPRLDALVLTIAPGGPGDDYAVTYVAGARGALALARRHGARRLVYTSSTGVYGRRDGAWVDERTPPEPAGPNDARLREAEEELLAAADVMVTVLRVAGIHGPGRDVLRRFAEPARLPRGGDYWVNLAHRDDIVAAIRHVLALEAPPTLLNCADGAPTLARDIATWLAARRAGHPVDPATLPFDPAVPLARSNQRVRIDALRATGWTPRVPSYRHADADAR
ncbi:MAG: NAD-dependent epimerase/dehydratase family protein [Gemmatimonadales bacterium]|nr:NAD-dependent epimerase/dehydratase family protein [Gemmatimonadales bacterium]